MRFVLLKPFYWAGLNRLMPQVGAAGGPSGRLAGRRMPWKAMAIGLFSILVCAVIYLTTLKVVGYFHKQNELGIILSLKIFQMVWITFFAMLVFSCMVSAVSSVFLSQDNEIIYAAPVSAEKLFFMRFTTIVFYTSWMMVLFSLPIFVAFGQVFGAGYLYWPFLLFSTVSTAMSAVGFGTAFTIVLVNIFPARRTKDIVFYLSLCFAVFIYAMFRLIRPEDLANPDRFGHFVDYLSSISGPTGPYVPGGWAADFLVTYLLDREVDWLLAGLLITTPLSLYFIGEWLMGRLFFTGYSKAQESFGGYRRFGGKKASLAPPWRWMMRKEAKTFLRDSAEWSQLFMIGALVVVYLYNFKVLPLDRAFWKEEYLANLISFLNIGLTGFVITSLSARFVFPSIGAEGGAFFIIRSSPLSVKKFLLHKYLFYVLPFLLLSVILVVVSDYLLKIEGPIWWISVGASIFLTLIVVALALGFGAIYANFKAENKAAAIGSMGSIIYLLTSLSVVGGILASGAWPSYRLTRKWINADLLAWPDFVWLAVWALSAMAVSGLIVRYFIRKGIDVLNGKS